MIFADNQTKHFYAMKSSDTVTVRDLQDSNLFRIEIKQGNDTVVSDVIDRKLILKAKINKVEDTFFRQWTVLAPDSVTANKTYHIYFYLENMMGFGMQDRWDRVASYTSKTGDTVATVMTALKNELNSKLNDAGPIKNDFTVTLNGNNIIVAENPNSSTYEYGDELGLLTHDYPYEYNVTMSVFDGDIAWKDQKQITARDTTTKRVKAATKVLDMERYFLRNRGDKYQLTKPFDISIINKSNTDTTATDYYTLDVDYAFSDTQGYTYHSNKQLSIACPTESKLTTLLASILGDSNKDAKGNSSTKSGS